MKTSINLGKPDFIFILLLLAAVAYAGGYYTASSQMQTQIAEALEIK